MSSMNSSSPLPGAIPPEAITAIIHGFSVAIRPSVGFILIGSVFAGTLIPILLALFYFSTSVTRKRPVFILNVLSLLLGIIIAIWNNHLELTAVLYPGSIITWQETTAFAIVFTLAPWMSELVLTLRLLVVFPPRITPKWKVALVFAFPIAIKIVRLSAILVYFVRFASRIQDFGNALQASESVDFSRSVYSKIEWFGQIFDNLYSSALFIWRLYQSHIFNNADGQRVTFGSSGSLTSRVKALFWIAVGNFVFPVIFDVILIIDIYVDPHYHVNATYFLFANYYIVVIGVVFATLWSSSFTYMQQHSTQGSLSWHVARPGTVGSTGGPVRAQTRNLDSSSDSERYDGPKTGEWDGVDTAGKSGEPIALRVLVDRSGSSRV